MSINIYHSRRINYHKCLYFERNDNIGDGTLAEWVLKANPAGVFYAKESNGTISKNEGQVNNAFLFENSTLTLETNDCVPNLQVGNIVLYNGKVWSVNGIQSTIHLKESEFGSGERIATTYIGLRR